MPTAFRAPDGVATMTTDAYVGQAVVPFSDEELTPDQLLDLGIMPDLAGWAGEQAISFVEAHGGFRAWPQNTFNDHVDAGFVTHTEPRAGTAVQTDVIQIFVAVPSPPVEPFMPPEPDVILNA
jgi:hypothetical protein